jgi:hypothetical protein
MRAMDEPDSERLVEREFGQERAKDISGAW